VLELGCGPGRYVALLAQLGFRVIGVDQSSAESIPNWQRIGMLPGVTLRGGVMAEALPFDDGTFDHAACLGALLYFNDVERALAETHRVLKPGGRLIVRTVNRRNLYTVITGKRIDPASKNLYTERELRDLLRKCGFEISESFSYGFWPPFGTEFWWYLVNTSAGALIQNILSALTLRGNCVNITVFATRMAVPIAP
jgi:ubiquinone/menaquinone biosynthesis C-methylase UbiE